MRHRSVWSLHLTKRKNLKFIQEKSEGGRTNEDPFCYYTSTKTDYCQSQDKQQRGSSCENQLQGIRCDAVIFANQQVEDKNSQEAACLPGVAPVINLILTEAGQLSQHYLLI